MSDMVPFRHKAAKTDSISSSEIEKFQESPMFGAGARYYERRVILKHHKLAFVSGNGKRSGRKTDTSRLPGQIEYHVFMPNEDELGINN